MRSFVILLSTLLALNPFSAAAITLDTFDGVQSVTSFGGSNFTSRSNRITQGAIGGTRSLDTTSTGGDPGFNITASTTVNSPFYLQIAQGPLITGITNVHWDGNTDASTIDFDGLAGIDLAEDGGTGFILKEVFFDFPDSKTATLLIRVYDASDSTGDTYSDYELLLDRAYPLEDIAFDFATPTGSGPSGAADIHNVGALVITVDGSNPAVDFSMRSFSTNGPCDLTPGVGGQVLDDCGECIPPTDPSYNQSCLDCLGVPNGTTLPGDSCETGEMGPCAPGFYTQDCSCDRVSDPTVEICDGGDNNCNGEIDETFPQLGEECGVEEEECNVTGVFICDDNGGAKCDLDFTNADLDGCDIEIGCDGIPGSGTKPDNCGICGGNGSTCADLGCDSRDISELLFELDGGAKEQEGLILSLTKIIKRKTTKKRIRERVKVIRDEANVRQIANWTLSWTLPIVSVECTSTLAADFCVFSDNNIILDEYRDGSEGLRNLGRKAARLLKKVTGNKQLAKRWRKRLQNRHNKNLGTAALVPETQTVCTSLT